MNEDELELGETDSEEEVSFPPAERKLITQPYDLSIQTLVEQWDDKLLILPEIQREYVWDNGRASRLIESLLLNIPIPVIYLSEDEESRYEIIDGHQRIRSIVRYLANEFSLSGIHILSEYRGSRFHQLPTREQRFLKMRTLRAVVITQESHPNMKFEVFERLNSGSISLNAQELRNSIYRGPFNRLLRELVETADFREVIGSKRPRARMVDEELVLRFLALHSNFDAYKPPLKRFLNEFMNSKKCAEEEELATLKDVFLTTVKRVKNHFDNAAFRITNDEGVPIERQINKALFDAQMLAFAWVHEDAAPRERILEEAAELYGDSAFNDSIRRATGDRARTRKRVREFVAALERAGVRIRVPFRLED